MKSILRRIPLLLLVLSGAVSSRADSSANWSGSITIPDNDASGVAFGINLNDPSSRIQSISLTLDISSGYSGDLYAYLSHGSQAAVLLNRIGRGSENEDGYSDSGLSLTLSSGASSDLHWAQTYAPAFNSSGQLLGTWAPDGRYIDPSASATEFDNAGRTAGFEVFNGVSAGGSWTLFIADVSPTFASVINGWTLDIVSIPEPSTLVLLSSGLLGLISWKRINR